MKTGLDRLLEHPARIIGKARVGLVANPTTVDNQLEHAIDRLHNHPDIDLRLLFGPEHGIRAVAQDMVSVDGGHDARTGLPIVSLYGQTFESLAPSVEALADIDELIFDIQDVGSRYYTYAATMALCMKQASQAGIRVIVLDRPNPIGGNQVEGGGLTEGLENFCGLFPVPQRHGMTVGELARLYNYAFGIECTLEVLPCDGWKREQYFDDTGLPWVLPSPNMPTLDTAIVYPGTCLLEGTTLSEGRGTTRPFEILGAPYIDGYVLVEELKKVDLPGILFRPIHFEPTFQKYGGQRCGGIQLHVTDRTAFMPYRTGLAILWSIRQLWSKDFEWRKDTYEFRNDVPAIDLLTGFPSVREGIDAGEPFDRVMEAALQGTEKYKINRYQSLLYK